MNILGWIKKSLLFLSLTFLLFCGAVAFITYSYGDQLISRFVAEVNQRIDTPIYAEKIEISWWEKFPHISIALRDVFIDGSLPGTTDTLGSARNIYCTFNAWDIVRGEWLVDQIHMEEGQLFLVRTEMGDNNFTIIRKDTSQPKENVGFKLDKVILKNVALTYLDLRKDQEYLLQAHEISASIASRSQTYHIDLSGEALSKLVRIENREFLKSKPLTIDGNIIYQEPLKKWDLGETGIAVNQSIFKVSGFYQGSDENLDIQIDGSNTDIQTLLSILPEEIRKQYQAYKSKGQIYFGANIKGLVAEDKSPEINIDFGCRNASFFHPNYKKGVEKVFLSGNFYSSQANDLSKAVLTLKQVKGVMESQPFMGNLTIQNLKEFYVTGDFKGTLDLNSWQRFLPPGNVTEASGTMKMNVAFEGPVHYLRTPKVVDKFKTSGEIFLSDLNFSLSKNSLPFNNFQGHFLFDGRDLAISDFRGNIGNSDFLINGFFRNIIAFLFSKNQPIGIEADLQAKNVDLDELLTGNTKAPDITVVGNQSYTSFEISPRLALVFDCKIDHLKFRRFRGHNIEGKLSVADQIVEGHKIGFETIGGKVSLNGKLNGKRKEHLTVHTKSSYQGIFIDSLFYIFENFNQEFLQDRHLKGQAFAEIDSRMAFDNFLRFKPAQLVVDAGLVIENGELNDFAPMQKLSSFVERRNLAQMKFADLKNDIHIEDRVIHLPNMVVQSNVTTIMVNGTHNFDQDIDYRLKVPLKSPKKDKDEYFGALEDDGLNTNLYLKILGNTKDYRIVYDKSAVKEKIQKDLHNEKWELRDAIRNKGDERSDQELNEDEFFDFNDVDSTTVRQ